MPELILSTLFQRKNTSNNTKIITISTTMIAVLAFFFLFFLPPFLPDGFLDEDEGLLDEPPFDDLWLDELPRLTPGALAECGAAERERDADLEAD
jgi:hypothetical protein